MSLRKRKGSGCCCGRCFKKENCRGSGGFVETGGGGDESELNFCCSCMPDYACVTLTGYCCEDSVKVKYCNQYSGTLSCGNETIDFSFSLKKEGGVCYLCLSSIALGYEDDGYDDTRICVAMGGNYNDPDVKKAECKALDFDFEVDLTPIDPYCENLGTINIIAADHVAKVDPAKTELVDCLYDRACITYKDSYTGNRYSVKACFDDYTQSWYGTIDTGSDSIDVNVFLDSVDPVVLSMTSELFDGDPEEAICPPYGKMEAEWFESAYDEGSSIKITGDDQDECSDCNCFCRCLCVTYYDSLRNVARTSLCIDGYDQWSTSSKLGPFVDLTFGLVCTGCTTKTTKISLGVTGATLISDAEQSIICPDQLEAEWSLEIADGETATVIIECLDCDGTCDVIDFGVDGCIDPEDRVTPLPIFLTATIENKSGCSNLDGQKVLLQLDGSVDTSSCWEGLTEWDEDIFPGGCITNMSFRCAGNGQFELKNDSCGFTGGYTGTVLSYDPLEVSFEGPPQFTEGCCLPYGVGSDIRVIVTE